MALDPVLVADTHAWLRKSAEDLRGAEHSLTAVPPLMDLVLYLCEQAAEKALKAFLYWHQQPFRRTHSLEELGAACLKLDSSLGPLVERVDSLTEYAWRTRYPGDEEEPAAEEVAPALTLAHEVYAAILDRLPPEVRP